ncbi:hypothetical protein GCM10027418_05540 [Mariniluteicoccus endophyticus]
MTTDTTPRSNPMPLTLLRIFAVLTAIGTLVQAALGGHLLMADGGQVDLHAVFAMITLVCSIVAATAAGLWAKRGGNTGMMWHALSVAVLALLQYGLGEMLGESSVMPWIHAAIGVVLLLAAAGLATLAFRKPYAAGVHNPLNESTHGSHEDRV